MTEDKSHLVNQRWVDIPEDDIFSNLTTLGLDTWHQNTLNVAGSPRHYLWAAGGYAYPYSLPPSVIGRLAARLNEANYMTWYRDYNDRAMAHFDEHGTALNQAAVYWVSVGDESLPKPEILPTDGLHPGDEYIAVIGLFHLAGIENGNNHHLFIDLIDGGGNRIYDHTPPLYLRYEWEGITGDQIKATDPVRIDKPGNEPGANIGLVWDQVIYGFFINNIAFDRFRGIHVRYEDDGPGNKRGHHSHYIVLQKRVWQEAGPVDPPDPDPDPDPPDIVNRGFIEVAVDKDYFNSLPVDVAGRVRLVVPIFR